MTSIEDRGLTHEAAVELLGVGQDEISKITRGQFRDLNEVLLLDLAEKLGGGGDARTLALDVRVEPAAALEWRKDHSPKSNDFPSLLRRL